MATAISIQSLYTQYYDDYGFAPKLPDHFMTYCKRKGLPLRYKECNQFLKNPHKEMNGEHIPNSAPSRRNSIQVSQYSDDEDNLFDMREHSRNTTHSTETESSKPSSKSMDSPPITSGLKAMLFPSQMAKQKSSSNSNNGFHKLNGIDIIPTLDASTGNYISPEILIDETIPIKDDRMNIRSYHRDLSELHIHKCPLFRDLILFILYWLSLINGSMQLYTFNLWYFRFICLFIWICCLIIGVLCHMYGRSPPFYPTFRGSDARYIKKLDVSAAQYVTEWNQRKYIKPHAEWTNIKDETMDDKTVLSMKLYHIEMYGRFRDSECGFVDVKAQRIENKSVDIMDDIVRRKNTLVRLRVFHILRFSDDSSYQKFVEMLRMVKEEKVTAVDRMFHIQYNVQLERRLLMNSVEDGHSVCSVWNRCCVSRRLSYGWYLSGFGFLYRFYHDCCIKTHVYDCIKEVTL
eukprot:497410_1